MNEKVEKVCQASATIFTNQSFIERIMWIANQEEKADFIALGESIIELIDQKKETEVPVPYEYCETSDQYGY